MKKHLPAMLFVVLMTFTTAYLLVRVYQLEEQVQQLSIQRPLFVPVNTSIFPNQQLRKTPDNRGPFMLLQPFQTEQRKSKSYDNWNFLLCVLSALCGEFSGLK